MGTKFYLTTAIDYSNGYPHVGHAYEKIGADCIARYRRLRGDDVYFVIGMDEHGQKVAQSAEAAGVDPQEWVDDIANAFRHAWAELAISHTDFIRTTEERHHRAVAELLRRIEGGGHFYEGTYAGYYCVGCEAFKQDKELVDGQCPLHPTREIKWVEEANYFFRQSAFVPQLLALYDANPGFVRPPAKLNEVRNVVAGGLQDISVSRSRIPWGILWPGDPSHTVYVWFDAVVNYLSATGFPDPGFEQMWPADLHVIGPDIARFHAALWPAMLMAARLPVPKSIWAHGWMTFSGSRFSKSKGVAVTLREAIDRYGTDPLRYFLLREMPWDADGNFTWERFDGRYNAELADGYGNLASRVLAMIERYLDGTIPDGGTATQLDNEGDAIVRAYGKAMDQYLLHLGGHEAWRLVARANAFVEESAPWNLAKTEQHQELASVLAALARALARITLMAAPFMPARTQAIWSALGCPEPIDRARWPALEHPDLSGMHVTKPPPVFPKMARI